MWLTAEVSSLQAFVDTGGNTLQSRPGPMRGGYGVFCLSGRELSSTRAIVVRAGTRLNLGKAIDSKLVRDANEVSALQLNRPT